MKWQVPFSQKLVPFLQGKLGDYSGKFLRKLLQANLCRINGEVERFGSRIVQGGDAVELAPQWETLLKAKPFALEILYEDAYLKIANKPAGWICSDPSLVHRLDKDTTGLLIMAKGCEERNLLMELFKRREVDKEYTALVDGVPEEKGGLRESFLAKKGAYQGQTIWGSSHQGAFAMTQWEVVVKGNVCALVSCRPKTGRTHQIRVHMAEMGHPILVDRQYAKAFRCPLFIQRPLLHASRLRFCFRGKEIDVTAPMPLDMRQATAAGGIPI